MDAYFFNNRDICRFLDALAIGAVLVGPDGRIIAVNRSAEQLIGAGADAVGQYWENMFRTFSHGRSCALAPASAAPTLQRVGIDFTDPQGEHRSLTRISYPLYQEDGKIFAGCLEVFQDHSAFKDLLKRVWYEDRRLKLILDSLDTGVVTVDRGGHITFFNRTAETVTGHNRSRILGRPFAELLHGDCRQDQGPLQETMADGTARSVAETWLLTRAGAPLPVRLHSVPLKNKEGRTVGGLVTVSDRSLQHQYATAMRDRYTFFDMVGRAPAMQQLFDILPVVAESDATVLIEGPTGTGKDLLAKVIHQASGRCRNPMVKVNCAALPDSLLESEIFGYVRGAFTGADKDKPGRFQEADGGTIFLDEIGDMPLSLQAKLLRVLEDGEFYPLGSRKPTRVDVRILSATNQDLEGMVEEKRFRKDLYYRLNVMRMEMPPLRQRAGDLPLLISHILGRLAAVKSLPVPAIGEDAMEVLLNHTYPGNVRELENILEHALIVCRKGPITRAHLPNALQRAGAAAAPPPRVPLGGRIRASEKHSLITTLDAHRWHRGDTAAALGIDRSTLWRKMKRHGLLSAAGNLP